MKCSYAAFGEQNKTDNDSKCQQVYKFLNLLFFVAVLVVYADEGAAEGEDLAEGHQD